MGRLFYWEFYKWHCITMCYTTTLPQTYWNYTKINAWVDQEVWAWEEKVGKATKFLGQMGILLIRDGYFHIGRVIIITIFPWQFLIIIKPKVIVITLSNKLLSCKNHKSSYWRCSVKERVFKNFVSNFIKKRLQHRCFLVKLAKFLRTSIFKKICERLHLQDITEKNNSSISIIFVYYFDFITITIIFEALKFLLSFCAILVFDNLFYEKILSFLLCSLSFSSYFKKIAYTWKNPRAIYIHSKAFS